MEKIGIIICLKKRSKKKKKKKNYREAKKSQSTLPINKIVLLIMI